MADVERCTYMTKLGVECGSVLSPTLIARGHGRCHVHANCKGSHTVCKQDGCQNYSRSKYGLCRDHVGPVYLRLKRERYRKKKAAQAAARAAAPADMRTLRGKAATPAEAAEDEMYRRMQDAQRVIAESLARED
jgi:hypothetical protein